MVTYSKQETIDRINKSLQTPPIDNLYNEGFINWAGKTKDTKEYYTEVLAYELLDNLTLLHSIRSISRKNPYKIIDHRNINIDLTSNRGEDIFAKRLAYLEIENLGKILDYQIPLKNIQKDKAGDIDLVSFNKERNTFHLIELKYENNNETLLRAILEIFTYYKVVDINRLLQSFPQENVDVNKIKVIPTVLVAENENCRPYKELEEMTFSGERPILKALSLALGVEFYSITIDTSQYEL
ncbi:MAG: hypothetical protein J7L53_10140 [Deltaproteobacteria bacterium]|nr:hypothetical protein [Deltaproteobacteria bacterium]